MGGKLQFAKVVKKSVKFAQKHHKIGQNLKTAYLGLGMNFLDIFQGSKRLSGHWLSDGQGKF